MLLTRIGIFLVILINLIFITCMLTEFEYGITGYDDTDLSNLIIEYYVKNTGTKDLNNFKLQFKIVTDVGNLYYWSDEHDVEAGEEYDFTYSVDIDIMGANQVFEIDDIDDDYD